MKRILLLFSVLLISSSLILAQTNPSGKTRQLDQRLIAVVMDSLTGFYDSTTYSYSGYRGSSFDSSNYRWFNNIDFDSKSYYRRDSGSLKLLNLFHRTYTANNQLTFELDSFYVLNLFSNNWVWVKNKRETYTYTSNNHLESKTYAVYDSNANSWNPYRRATYKYPSPTELEISNGNWDGIILDTNTRETQIFQNGNIVSRIYNYKSNGIWLFDGKDSISIIATASDSTRNVYNWNTIDSSWYPFQQYYAWFNSNMQLDSVRKENYFQGQLNYSTNFYPEWIGNRIAQYFILERNTDYKVIMTYNANGYPILEQGLIKSGANYYSSIPGAYEKRFYYETYNNNVSTNDFVKHNLSLTIFPNPTSSKLRLSLQEGNITSIEISNLQGQLLIKQVGEISIVDVAALPIGQYIIKVQDKSGKFVNQQFTKK
jgi:hypothetical protein